VKGKMHQCLEWKYYVGAKATLAGVDLWSIIKNGQIDNPGGLHIWDEFSLLQPNCTWKSVLLCFT